MGFHQTDDLHYYTFPSLVDAGVTHAVFTRRGGVSPSPWDSLNVGGLVGDEVDRVKENRRRSFVAVDRDVATMYDVWQVHGDDVVCAGAPRPLDMPHLKADVILTDRPEVTLFMRFADCVPIVLYDPHKKVVGLAHAGWMGTVKKTASAAVRAMQECYGSQPGDLLAGIGPSIAVHHYEIGEEVAQQVRQAFSDQAHSLLVPANGDAARVRFDLWAANRLILQQSGVRQIEIAGLCTACHLDDWYSHRGEKGKTGRFGVIIGL